MNGYFQKLFEDVHHLESVDERIEKLSGVRFDSPADSCLFQMLYLTQGGEKEMQARWKELEDYILERENLPVERENSVRDVFCNGIKNLYINMEFLAKPLIKGTLYLSEQMVEARNLGVETILKGQLIQDALNILEGSELKVYSKHNGLSGKTLQQAVGAGQIWQISVDGMVVQKEFYQNQDSIGLDSRQAASVLAYIALKNSFMKKAYQEDLGRKLQQSMGTSYMAAENFQKDLDSGSANKWLISLKRDELLDIVSCVKGERKIVQAINMDLRKEVSADKEKNNELKRPQVDKERKNSTAFLK